MIPEGNPKDEGCRGKGCPLHGEGNGGSAFLWVLISDIKQSSSVACGPGHLGFSHSNIRCDAPGHLDFSRSDTRGGNPEHLDFSHSETRGDGPGQVIISKLCRHSHVEPRNRKPVLAISSLRRRHADGLAKGDRKDACPPRPDLTPRWCALPSPRRPDLTPAAVWRGIRPTSRRDSPRFTATQLCVSISTLCPRICTRNSNLSCRRTQRPWRAQDCVRTEWWEAVYAHTINNNKDHTDLHENIMRSRRDAPRFTATRGDKSKARRLNLSGS